MKHVSGNLYALFAALLWGSTAAVVKLIGSGFNSIQILFYSSLIASVSLACIITYQKKWPVIRAYRGSDFLRFAGMSFIGVFLYYALLYTALQMVPGQEAFIVNYTWPIWVVIFAVALLKERLDARKVVAIILSFIGVYIVITRGNLNSFYVGAVGGNVLALIAACLYGLFSVMSKKNNDDKVTSTFFFYVFAFVFTSVYLMIFSHIPSLPINVLPNFLWLGAMTSGLGFILWQLALKHGEISKVSNIVFITPFVSLVYLDVLVHEHIVFSSIVGAVLIVGGIVFQSTWRQKRRASPSVARHGR